MDQAVTYAGIFINYSCAFKIIIELNEGKLKSSHRNLC